MKVTTSVLSLLPALASASHFPREKYESGEIHQMIMDMKNVRLSTYNPRRLS
jgi:hypothetical protein